MQLVGDGGKVGEKSMILLSSQLIFKIVGELLHLTYDRFCFYQFKNKIISELLISSS